MVIGDKFIYLELHKTGSTYISKILTKLDYNSNVQIGKHNTYKDVYGKFAESNVEFNSKYKLGSIRNPWDWYVSLWAYGCLSKGALYNRLALDLFKLKKETVSLVYYNPSILLQNRRKWRKLYSNSEDVEAFRTWLKLILIQPNSDLNTEYHQSNFSKKFGLLTYRYLSLFTYNFKENYGSIKNVKDIEDYDHTYNFLNLIIRTEAINEALLNNHVIFNVEKESMQKAIMSVGNGRNQSKRLKTFTYYDNDSIKLIERKEEFIIKKYGYTFSMD